MCMDLGICVDRINVTYHAIHKFFMWKDCEKETRYKHSYMHCTKKATIHHVTTMLVTSKNVIFPGYNHLLTTGTDDPTLWLSPERWRVKGHEYW